MSRQSPFSSSSAPLVSLTDLGCIGPAPPPPSKATSSSTRTHRERRARTRPVSSVTSFPSPFSLFPSLTSLLCFRCSFASLVLHPTFHRPGPARRNRARVGGEGEGEGEGGGESARRDFDSSLPSFLLVTSPKLTPASFPAPHSAAQNLQSPTSLARSARRL